LGLELAAGLHPGVVLGGVAVLMLGVGVQWLGAYRALSACQTLSSEDGSSGPKRR
jgi:hypothetical protein